MLALCIHTFRLEERRLLVESTIPLFRRVKSILALSRPVLYSSPAVRAHPVSMSLLEPRDAIPRYWRDNMIVASHSTAYSLALTCTDALRVSPADEVVWAGFFLSQRMVEFSESNRARVTSERQAKRNDAFSLASYHSGTASVAMRARTFCQRLRPYHVRFCTHCTIVLDNYSSVPYDCTNAHRGCMAWYGASGDRDGRIIIRLLDYLLTQHW